MFGDLLRPGCYSCYILFAHDVICSENKFQWRKGSQAKGKQPENIYKYIVLQRQRLTFGIDNKPTSY